MKKNIFYIFAIVIIIVVIIASKYYNYKERQAEIQEFNLQYEKYYQEETYGTDIATLINLAIDNNEKNYIDKDSQGFYITNDENSVEIEIKILDNDTTYKMETLYNGELYRFVQNYSYILFKGVEIKYNSKGKVSYMLFEQTTK